MFGRDSPDAQWGGVPAREFALNPVRRGGGGWGRAPALRAALGTTQGYSSTRLGLSRVI